ncbi:MAG TPA: CHAT domain-containing protein, partial [Candidatus Kapabacteria bacterium]|nr:CHAT domain-containing protein [Candidatus Kapabacteria bacterium]
MKKFLIFCWLTVLFLSTYPQSNDDEQNKQEKKKSALNDLIYIHSKLKEREKSIEFLKDSFDKALPKGGQEDDPAIRERLEAIKNELNMYYRKDYFVKEYEVNPETGYLGGKGTLTFLNLLYECVCLKNYKLFDELIDMYDKVRFNLTENDFRLSYASTSIGALNNLANFRLARENYKDAFMIAERAKCMIFSEIMARRGAREMVYSGNSEFKHYIEREIEIYRSINKIKTTMKTAPKTELKQLGFQVASLFTEFDKLQLEFMQKFPRYSEFLYPTQVEPEALQALLKKDETYISYALFNEETMAFIITRNDFNAVKLNVGQDWVKRQITKMRSEITKSFQAIELVHKEDRKRFPEIYDIYSNYPASSRELYMKIFAPLTSYIQTNKIIIAANDILYGFPFEALVTEIPGIFEYGGKKYSTQLLGLKMRSAEIPLFYEYSQMKYLGNKYSFSYIPSASTLNVLRGALKKERTEVEGVIAFADPIFSEMQLEMVDNKKTNWPPPRLPESAEEAEIFVKQIGKGKIYKILEATEENIWKANLEKAKYILFSTHGFLANENEHVV